MDAQDKSGLKGAGLGLLVSLLLSGLMAGAELLLFMPPVVGGVIGFRKGRESPNYCPQCGVQYTKHHVNEKFCLSCGEVRK